ncbi:uncharacterized protein LOC134207301 [Armigeres subalbatus]|uniref:uncharacterized protein LOC134207301 n=1 Tax=Armigeres subalbatus TaxID=124917 RepID=UPI002ED1A0DF
MQPSNSTSGAHEKSTLKSGAPHHSRDHPASEQQPSRPCGWDRCKGLPACAISCFPCSTDESDSNVQPSVPVGSLGYKPLSFYYQNVRGLRTKIESLQTWLHSDISNAEISSDYTIYRGDRSESTSLHSRGGGVLIAAKNNLDCDTVSLMNCNNLEQVAIRINSELYSTHVDAVQSIIEQSSESDIILSIGGFNLPNLHWQLDHDINGYVPSNMSTDPERILIETLFATSMRQMNGFGNHNGRLLDLAFVNLPEYFDLLLPSSPMLPLDAHHEPYILLLDDPGPESVNPGDRDASFTFDFKTCDFNTVNRRFADVHWDLLLANKTVNEMVQIFNEKINTIINDHPWWTFELRNLRNNLRKSRRRYFRLRSANDRDIVRELEMSYKSLLSSSYNEYITRIQSKVKNDPSCFWDFVKKRTSINRIPPRVNYEDNIAQSNTEAADLFADFFEKVFTKSPSAQRNNFFAHIPTHDIALPIIQFSPDEIQYALDNLDGNKGAGTDGFPPPL